MINLDGRFVHFKFIRKSESGKTDVYDVLTNDDDTSIGVIKWYTPWRKYSFYPDINTVYEHICLNDIINFLKTLKQQKETGDTRDGN